RLPLSQQVVACELTHVRFGSGADIGGKPGHVRFGLIHRSRVYLFNHLVGDGERFGGTLMPSRRAVQRGCAVHHSKNLPFPSLRRKLGGAAPMLLDTAIKSRDASRGVIPPSAYWRRSLF